jgi:hypothetical protein
MATQLRQVHPAGLRALFGWLAVCLMYLVTPSPPPFLILLGAASFTLLWMLHIAAFVTSTLKLFSRTVATPMSMIPMAATRPWSVKRQNSCSLA